MSSSKQVAAAIAIGLSSFAFASPIADISTGIHVRNTTGSQQQAYYPANAICSEYMIPITITSTDNVFNFTHWDNDYALQEFLALATTRVGAGYPGVVEGTKNVTRDVEIAASFCTPSSPNGKETNVILATHGIGPGREHWNSEYKPETYNFVSILHSVRVHDCMQLLSRLTHYVGSSRYHRRLLCLLLRSSWMRTL